MKVIASQGAVPFTVHKLSLLRIELQQGRLVRYQRKKFSLVATVQRDYSDLTEEEKGGI